jgi:hypothetical protein
LPQHAGARDLSPAEAKGGVACSERSDRHREQTTWLYHEVDMEVGPTHSLRSMAEQVRDLDLKVEAKDLHRTRCLVVRGTI